MRPRMIVFTMILIVLSLLTVLDVKLTAAQLVWQTSKQAAVNLAQQQQKKILLVAGRDT